MTTKQLSHCRNFRDFPNFREASEFPLDFAGKIPGSFRVFQLQSFVHTPKMDDFPGTTSGIFRNFWKFPEIFRKCRGFPRDFGGENSGVFSCFTVVIVYKRLQNDRFSGDDFRDFPEFPEIPENFRKIPEFRNFGNSKNSRNFRKFPATGFF